MQRQIIIHAGFHKTGTTSVQATLQANGQCIWPTHALVLPKRIPEVLRMATLHSVMRGPVSLTEFRARLGEFLETLKLGRKRGLIMSAEDLSGLIPGRRGHSGYDACPDLMAAIFHCLRHVFGPDIDVTFVFGLRDKPDWLQSAYWQNLRSSRLTQPLDQFAESLADLDLEAVVAATSKALPEAKVVTMWLEAIRDTEFGPATPILELARLRPEHRETLRPARIANVQPSADVLAAVLAMNQSAISDTALVAQKAELLDRLGPVSISARRA